MSGDPQADLEAQSVARSLLQRPLTCAEQDPEQFRLIRRHAATLDRWFTQRFGDRVHVDADTARLYKSVAPPADRPLRTAAGRALRQVEYVMLALSMGAVASGPDVISLRDLVASVRSAAADAGVEMSGDAGERRALVTALQWMIAKGLLFELHDRVERYSTDGDADAVLRVRADRIALVPLAGTSEADSDADLRRRAHERGTPRQRMRSRLANDPVIYRGDLEPEGWSELRRRLGEEAAILDEVLGLGLEARAEGVAAIDPGGSLSDRRFPAGGTESHAALLLIDRLVSARAVGADAADLDRGEAVPGEFAPGESTAALEPAAPLPGDVHRGAEVTRIVQELAEENARRWKSDLVERPDRLTGVVVDLLVDMRLAERVDGAAERPDDITAGTTVDGSHGADQNGDLDWSLRILPGAARFALAVGPSETDVAGAAGPGAGSDRAEGSADQASLW